MNEDNRFKPPAAVLSDVVPDAGPRAPLIALLCAGLIPLAWLVLRTPGYLRIVSSNAMNPLVMLSVLAGMLCFVVGLVRAFPRGLRGRKSFGMAITLVLLPLLTIGPVVLPVYALVVVFAPFLLAVVVAVAGFIVVGQRRRRVGARP